MSRRVLVVDDEPEIRAVLRTIRRTSDVYVVLPREVVARVGTVLRRSSSRGTPPRTTTTCCGSSG